MKRLLFAAVAWVLGSSTYGQEWNWQDIGRDIQSCHAQFEMFNSVQSVEILRYRASSHRTGIVNDPAQLADSVSALGKRHHAVGALNGSYFDVKQLTPATFVKDDGQIEGITLEAESYRTDGIVALKGLHKVIVLRCDTSQYKSVQKKYREILASGPVLVSEGKPAKPEWPEDSFFTGRHPRSILGTDDKGWVYFIVVDGRAGRKAAGMTIPEAVSLVQLLGLSHAINLDGGGSSTLWTDVQGVNSYPCDNRRYDHTGQRIVPNAVIVR